MNFNLNEGGNYIYNVPFNMYVEGSYFGDSDVLAGDGKASRDGTAIADCECHLLVINRKDLNSILKHFKKIKEDMVKVA